MQRTMVTALTLTGLAVLATGQVPPASAPRDDVDPDAVKTVWEYLAGRYDTNEDGKISKDEYKRGDAQFARLDRDGNGFIEEADTKQKRRRRGARGCVRRLGAGG